MNTSNNCKYCNASKPILKTRSITITINTENNAKALNIECDPCPDYAQCGLYHITDRAVTSINYCPICGRDLRKE